MANLLIVEPFYGGSHASWANEYIKHSQHNVEILGMSAHYWKWRMHGGAVTLARKFMEMEPLPDAIIASDMVDLTTFMALTRHKTANIPIYLYFHENQLTYPWSPADTDPAQKRDRHYGFINYTSALAASGVFFNSQYHLDSFLRALKPFLQAFPDHQEMRSVSLIESKSRVLPLGMDLGKLHKAKPNKQPNKVPLILWNHRWEYDKNPELFFQTLIQLAEDGLNFEIAVLGEGYKKTPSIFAEVKAKLADRIIQWGFVEDQAEYISWLWKADIFPVTGIHDFFGRSVVEALATECLPLLPNRLAYPEHLPSEFQEGFMYDTPIGFQTKLAEMIQVFPQPTPPELAAYVQKYDWRVLARIYDQAFYSG